MANDLNLMRVFMEKPLLPAGELLNHCPRLKMSRSIVMGEYHLWSATPVGLFFGPCTKGSTKKTFSWGLIQCLFQLREVFL